MSSNSQQDWLQQLLQGAQKNAATQGQQRPAQLPTQQQFRQPTPRNVSAGPSIGTAQRPGQGPMARGPMGVGPAPTPQAGQPGAGPYRPPGAPSSTGPAPSSQSPYSPPGGGNLPGMGTSSGGPAAPVGNPFQAAPAGSGNMNGSGGQHVPMGLPQTPNQPQIPNQGYGGGLPGGAGSGGSFGPAQPRGGAMQGGPTQQMNDLNQKLQRPGGAGSI